ncbi:unnamed protein product [Mucor hiemalis]
MNGGSTLTIQPTTTKPMSLFRRKSNWTKKPKKTFLSLLMCCTFQKKSTTAKSSPSITPTSITEKNIVSTNITTPSNDTVRKEVEFNERIQQPRDDEKETIQSSDQEEEDEEEGVQITCLLEPIEKEYRSRKCLVLDLDETLIHSSFKTVAGADFIVPVEIEGHYHNVFVLKRPGVDDFMKRMGELYEIVIFTASLSKYADPVLDRFDLHKVINHRLFRESCHSYKGTYIKDLSRLGRDLKQVIILDNTPASYSFHPSNAVPVSTWFNDQHDSELIDLIPFLEDLARVDDVVEVLDISLMS